MASTDSPPKRGMLVVFEGIDGAGKTTVCNILAERLRGAGHDVVVLREPTKESPWGREIIERSPWGELTPEEELQLFMRDRRWNVENRILPALGEGKVVLLDRYFFATGAYQSVSTKVSWAEILRMNREELHAPDPDIVFLLDVPVQVGLERAVSRKGATNIQFERPERLVRVRQVYLEMAREYSDCFRVVDATRPIDAVVDEVFDVLMGLMGQ